MNRARPSVRFIWGPLLRTFGMTRHVLRVLFVAGLVLLAGCAGGLSGGTDSSPTDAGQDSPATAAPTDGGTVAFYISDEKNAIGDFRHLNVTVTSVGFQRGGNESGGWVEHDVDNATVDLTDLQGENATLVDEYRLQNGTYNKVFVHVGEVNATLQDGEHVRVKLPSEKLQLNKGFTVENGSQVEFVFDITVHEAGKSGKYILKPVVGESGTEVPIESVDDEAEGEEESEEAPDDEADDLNASFVGNVSQGENATLSVTRNGTAVENATVLVNGETVGTTDVDGELAFAVPDTETARVTVRADDQEVELEREFESDSG